MSKRSLMLMGRPSTADRTMPAARKVSEARAWANADSAYSFVNTRAPSPASSRARASAASVSCTAVVRPSLRAKVSSFKVETIIVLVPSCGVKVRTGAASRGAPGDQYRAKPESGHHRQRVDMIAGTQRALAARVEQFHG
ncbi:hypothetical protein G6F68_015059 [Rhizopus microsporus]|nr:hypothetical protein G6F68_015059 [Rhizopus microsporus]